MATQQHPPPTVSLIKRPLLKVFFIAVACCLCYFLGSYSNPNSTISTIQPHPHKCFLSNASTPNLPSLVLDFEAHHILPLPPESSKNGGFFDFCPANFTHYSPCQDPSRAKQFKTNKFFHQERHCPGRHQALQCLVPPPNRYRRPFPWPESREYAWFSNVPFPKLSVYKKSQNWVRVEGDRLVFPGGGTSFPKGVKEYVDQIRRVVPLMSGNIRTALDVGCGVASFGASLMDYKILTMSIAPVDLHEAQVQFALERGLPAMHGILSTYRLPYPSRSFDMAHCSRCLVPWTAYDGVYLMEIDRVLRPGGYWVLSGPPISWKSSYKGWERTTGELKQEQIDLEDLARRLCWKKIAERGPIAVWRKPTNHIHCTQKLKAWKSPRFCAETDADAGWYREMDPCITRLPKVTDIRHTSGGVLAKWPKRLNTAPPRIEDGVNRRANVDTFYKDNKIWTKRISYYGSVLKSLGAGRYRNIMDMNADIGGFAAAISNLPAWVMNVVPFDAQNNTLGIIYERGLIGTYMNWCEAFSTYPRTYDLIHAHGVFSMYIDKCDILDILFEMHRILRPEGAAIIRDHVDIIVKVKGITDRMRWKSKILHSEYGPFHPEKILFVDNSEI